MTTHRFDQISKLFAHRKLTRRQALATGGGLAAGAIGSTGLGTALAQDATPASDAASFQKTMYLFVQSFQSGSIVPTEGVEGRYTVTLNHGLGQTIYFGDRPSRDVGATPTPQFLEGLGFPEDNPPNAAMLLETAPGETDIAVVELFNPTYDERTNTATYDVEVLANWQDDGDQGFRDAPAALADLATMAAEFGTAHLLIDDCPTDLAVVCQYTEPSGLRGRSQKGSFSVDSCWNYSVCMPCEPYGHNQPSRCATWVHWNNKCNATFAACQGKCYSTFNWAFADCDAT